MPEQRSLRKWIASEIADPGTSWSLGTFGAIAEFMRDADEPADIRQDPTAVSVVTDRGGIRIGDLTGVRATAYETAGKHPNQWNHAIALCMSTTACGMHRRTVVTELGPDANALREKDRSAILFDIGLGAAQVDVCVRTAQPLLIAALRESAGQSLFAPGNRALTAILREGPHRVFAARPGRIEVYQPIPTADGQSPDGPHTHILPKLLGSGRTHAATNPVPDGLVPCAHLYPAHPTKDAYGRPKPFDQGQHRRFQELLARYGVPELLALKQSVAAAVRASDPPSSLQLPGSKFARANVRVTLRQLREQGTGPSNLSDWISLFDHPSIESADEDEQSQHRSP